MKYFLALFLVLITSCSSDNGAPEYHSEIMPIDTIYLPTSFNLNQTYTIDFTFIKPTSCYVYNNLFINSGNQENRTLAVNTVVYEHSDCIPLSTNNIETQSFDFKVIYDQVYTFHIWKGKDGQGNDLYEDIDIPVN